MISARKFCQEPGYPVSIFLTYSFDPLFFERIPIDDLDVGGSRRVIVVADAGEIAEAMRRCIGQIVHLGRRYVLAETRAANLFHPKMIIRLSPTGGRVWIGSGNLTYTGWGGNQELATAWSIGPGTDDHGGWLDRVLSAIASVTNSAALLSQLDAVQSSITWLRPTPTTSPLSPVLLGMPNRPLAPQLADRWKGRQFTELKVYTGSTDVEGAFLLWAHKTFGIATTTICLSPTFASFDAGKLSKLPFDVGFVETDPKRLMHAKFYWFSGPGGCAAVMGSANCSAAAWLAKHEGGNVELVAVYDQAELADFGPILAAFNGKRLLPSQILKAQPTKPKETDGDDEGTVAYRIVSLRLRTSGRIIEAKIEPLPSSDNAVHLVVDVRGDEIRVPMVARGSGFVGRLPPDRSIGVAAVFATIEVGSGAALSVTPPRWIDNEPAIERGAREREIDPDLEAFAGRGFGNSSQQRIMEAIYAVSADLLNLEEPDLSPLSFEAAGSAPQKKNKEASEEPVRMLDPAAMLFSLRDLTASKGGTIRDHIGSYGVSLDGIMKLLFAVEDEPEIDLSHETWTADEPGGDPEGEVPDPHPEENAKEETFATVSSAETLTAFREQIDFFLLELAKPSFAMACPAGTLVKAVTFPILLCVKGNEARWLPDGMLASVASRVVDTMLSKSYGRDKPKGLFRQVQARYQASGRLDEFLRIVGEGALWTVLLASLARMESDSLESLIRQAAAISAVLTYPELIAASNSDQLSTFVHTLVIRDAEFAITERAVKLADAMSKLTVALSNNWDRVYLDQGKGRALHSGGSVMWSPRWGWEFLPRWPAQSYCSDHINLGMASASSDEIRVALDRLREAMQMQASSSDTMSTA